MAQPQEVLRISAEEYLDGEISSEIKHELVDGFAYAMAGASKNHERIAGNLYRKFGNQFEDSPCEPFGSDMKVKVDDNFYYPDVMVVCDDQSDNEYYANSPVIIVEVISKSTRQIDQTLKRQNYQQLPSLQEYVLIEQDFVDIEVVRKNDGWRSSRYYLGDDITFDSIDFSVSVEEIYLKVKNEDVENWLKQQAEADLEKNTQESAP